MTRRRETSRDDTHCELFCCIVLILINTTLNVSYHFLDNIFTKDIISYPCKSRSGSTLNDSVLCLL